MVGGNKGTRPIEIGRKAELSIATPLFETVMAINRKKAFEL